MNTVTDTPKKPKKPVLSRVEQRARAAADTRPRITLSFYRYVRLADPEAFRQKLLQKWGEFGCMGRIYVASEGVNAQMNVPKANWAMFDAWTQSLPELRNVPYKIAVEEGSAPSFYKLTIKVRDKIVADGLDDTSFDVTNTGAYLTAAEMNEYVTDPDAVIVDMRNNYESEIGHFEGAILPNVVTFRDELKNTPELLKIHKNKKIALYCTGGIRCEKASAWLKHNGFENVKHLKGGIIDYKHQVEREGLDNKFRGKNFVFDERLGERIGDEVISTCHLCKKNKSDTHYHCKNQICHELFLGCDECIEKKQGYCSWRCKTIDKLPANTKKKLARYYNEYVRKRKPFIKTGLAN
ncbi:rhodanese-related sulfurtransferase [Candidatus Kaiserbacteria bacterium]|nr:rhodanese-related sulfurtransferase [Candidatus Kaiserbacteria bacterium]